MSNPTGQHTPGPWKYEQGSDPSDFIVSEPTGRTICEPNDPLYADDTESFAPGLRYISIAEAQANGRLIAASPELWAALKDAEPLLMKLCTVVMNEKVAEYLPFGLLDEVKKWIAHSGAQKAIAKAERGQ